MLGMIVLVMLLGLFAGMVIHENIEEREAKNLAEERQKEVRPIRVKRNQVIQKLDALEDEYKKKINGLAVSGVLFTDLNERIYSEIYPVMEAYGRMGTIVISYSCLVEQENKMNWEQFGALMDYGWTWCPAWNQGDSLEQIEYVLEQLSSIEEPLEGVLYFQKDAYAEKYKTQLLQEGYQLILHHGENNLSLTKEEESGLIYIGVVGIQGESPRYQVEKAVSANGVVFNAVGYLDENDQYEQDKLEAMLNTLKAFETDETLLFMNPKEAMEYKKEISACREKRKAEYTEKKESLENEKEELEKQIGF